MFPKIRIVVDFENHFGVFELWIENKFISEAKVAFKFL